MYVRERDSNFTVEPLLFANVLWAMQEQKAIDSSHYSCFIVFRIIVYRRVESDDIVHSLSTQICI